jgi:UDP-3-O-[3-hydroxymyristoyl] N-acetylglucosamine deacetylase
MWDKIQKTLNQEVNFEGIGLHSGVKSKLSLKPANANEGIIFKRVDLDQNNEIHANFKNVSSAKLCTKIQNTEGASVSTVEHLMAALYICGVDNILITIDGPEVPIMDGSSKDFVEAIKLCGLKSLDQNRKFLKILRKVHLKENNKSISIEPVESTFNVDFKLEYDNPLIKTQSNNINFQDNDLINIYTARTFCLYEDVEKIKAAGLAKGGSLDNAVVIQGEKVLNKKGLRCKKEFVNHKILDLAGDFMLAGKRILGSVKCVHGGHELTNNFLKKVFSDTANFSITDDLNFSPNVRKVVAIQKRLVVNA